jgi:hypothetical protein
MEFIYKSNSGIYKASLENPESAKLITERNITNLIAGQIFYYQPEDYRSLFSEIDYYTGICSSENKDYSTLYLFESSPESNGVFEVVDSIAVNKGAKKICF